MSPRHRFEAPNASDDDPTRTRRAWFFRGFREYYALGYVRNHFHAVRQSLSSHPLPTDEVPLIVVLNHPSWWDPLICTVLSRSFDPREQYAAIDATAIQKYGFFRKLGFFGVDTESLRGAASFLRTATALLRDTNRVLWLTAQGRFVDVRTRPLDLRTGVGHLAARLDRGMIIPLALEYSFWTESTPEALVRWGKPLDLRQSPTLSGRDWTARIEAALTETLDQLNAETMSRDPSRFEVILGGRAGVGGCYDVWRRMKAWLRGQQFNPEHATTQMGTDSGDSS
jgi:1-acyl-sn-glycerol-3-phosphate acyltransferase